MSARRLRTRAAVPRILIVRVGAMGDVIHALPAVAALRTALPHAHIGWAVEPRWAPLLRSSGAEVEPHGRDAARMPLIDAVHLVEAKQWNRSPLSTATAKSVGALRSELRAAQYDLAIDLQGTLRSAAIARIGSGAPVLGSSVPREPLARILYTHRIPQTATHVIRRGLELIEAALHLIGTDFTSEPHADTSESGPAPRIDPVQDLLPAGPAAEAWWRQQGGTLCAGEEPVLLAATAGWGAKEWPPEKFAALAAQLAGEGECVLLNTTAQGIDPVTGRVLELVSRHHPSAMSAVHPLPATLPQLIAATREARCVIAGDTGPLHLASALQRPSVGLFGPTDPARTGGWGNSLSIRGPGSVTDHRRHAATEAGLARIPVEAVMDVFHAVMDTAADTGAAAAEQITARGEP